MVPLRDEQAVRVYDVVDDRDVVPRAAGRGVRPDGLLPDVEDDVHVGEAQGVVGVVVQVVLPAPGTETHTKEVLAVGHTARDAQRPTAAFIGAHKRAGLRDTRLAPRPATTAAGARI